MKKCIVAILVAFSLSLTAQETAKVRTYGGALNDYGSQIIESSNGGYAIIGTTGSYGQGQSNMYLLKIDIELNIEWSQVFGGSNLDWGQSIVEVDDGYLMLGYTSSFGSGGYDIFLVKCDLNGEFMWQKTYGGTDWDFGYNILEHNNGYYICGETWSFSNGGTDAYLIHIDSDGNELWSGNFGGAQNEIANSLFVGANGVIAVGENNSVTDKSKLYLIEVSDDYLVSEQVINNDTLWSEGQAGVLHSNGNYYITGSQQAAEMNFLFMRFDENFVPQPVSNNPYGGNLTDRGFDIVEISNGGLTMVGSSNSFAGSTGAFLFRVTANGNYGSAPTFGSSNTEVARSTIINSGGRLMAVGETNGFGAGNNDVYLIELNNDTVVQNYDIDLQSFTDNLLTSIEPGDFTSPSTLLFYPNPAQNEIFISAPQDWQQLRIYDISGRIVQLNSLTNGSSEISLRSLRPGTYVIELSAGENIQRERLIVK